MKKTILIALCFIAMSSCSTVKITKDWIGKNCKTENVAGYQFTKCENLYPSDKVKQVCSAATITYDVANASVEIKTKCLDSVNIVDLVSGVINKK